MNSVDGSLQKESLDPLDESSLLLSAMVTMNNDLGGMISWGMNFEAVYYKTLPDHWADVKSEFNRL